MVRWALGVTRKDNIKNEYVRGTAKIAKLGDKLRSARLHWCGNIKRRKEGYVGKRMTEMAIPGKRKRGRPKRRWINLVKEVMEMVGAREGDEVDQALWRRLSRRSDPKQGKAERRRRASLAHSFLLSDFWHWFERVDEIDLMQAQSVW